MGQPAAKQGDRVTAVDLHLILQPPPSPPIPLPHRFDGILDGSLSADVMIEGRAAATVGSTATNTPAHTPSGSGFAIPPRNRATVARGSLTVLINGKPAARAGDTALTCNDPIDLPVGQVVATSTVQIGG